MLDERQSSHERIEESAWSALIRSTDPLGWTAHKPEGLVVPYFASEFNRCIDHQTLNRVVAAPKIACHCDGWRYRAPACRINDTRKVDSGWHSTFFELFVALGFFESNELRDAANVIVGNVVRFLVSELGLDRTRIHATYFAGGELLPGISVPEDNELKRAWLDAGIPERNLVAIKGPKNFLLFIGNGERCGPKSEVFYDHCRGGKRFVELGTIILDSGRLFGRDGHVVGIEPAATIAAGVAYGLERVLTVANGLENMMQTPVLAALLTRIREYSQQDNDAWETLKGDATILADQIRSCVLIKALCGTSLQDGQKELVQVMARRIGRKLLALCIKDPEALLRESENDIYQRYASRFGALNSPLENLYDTIRSIEWPKGWNPESYRSCEV